MNGDDEKLSTLYRKAATEQPPARIDARILAASRKPSRVMHSPFARSWAVPASLAAVLVLAVGLVTFMDRRDGLREQASVITTLQAPDAETAADAAASRPAESRPATEQLKSYRLERAPMPAAPSPATEMARERREAEEQAARLRKSQAETESPGAAGVGSVQPRDENVQQLRPEFVDPQQWLDHIRALKEQGRLEEARASLAEFRRRYPDRRLPPDLDPGQWQD